MALLKRNNETIRLKGYAGINIGREQQQERTEAKSGDREKTININKFWKRGKKG